MVIWKNLYNWEKWQKHSASWDLSGAVVLYFKELNEHFSFSIQLPIKPSSGSKQIEKVQIKRTEQYIEAEVQGKC